jgi:hypothetical protein
MSVLNFSNLTPDPLAVSKNFDIFNPSQGTRSVAYSYSAILLFGPLYVARPICVKSILLQLQPWIVASEGVILAGPGSFQ